MTEEKSIEELEAMHKELLMKKIAKLQDEEKEAEEKAEKEKEEESKNKEREEMKAEIRADLVKEMGDADVSKITSEPETMKKDLTDFEVFKNTFAKKHDITGKPYGEYIHGLAYGEYK